MKTPRSYERRRQDPVYRRACRLLRRMGVTPSYAGFHQAARAACEAARRPELMLSLSKWLYPLVAREMNTSEAAVERNIRTVILRAWRRNPELLRQCAEFPLEKRPTCGEFLALRAACLEDS